MRQRPRARQMWHSPHPVHPVRDPECRNVQAAAAHILYVFEFVRAVNERNDFEVHLFRERSNNVECADAVASVWSVWQPMGEKENPHWSGPKLWPTEWSISRRRAWPPTT